ncbi:MAG: hypothetical protein WA423_02845, partial [Candidatus Sulfotelmatobacter sp.]
GSVAGVARFPSRPRKPKRFYTRFFLRPKGIGYWQFLTASITAHVQRGIMLNNFVIVEGRTFIGASGNL